jgi:hypothetical protein
MLLFWEHLLIVCVRGLEARLEERKTRVSECIRHLDPQETQNGYWVLILDPQADGHGETPMDDCGVLDGLRVHASIKFVAADEVEALVAQQTRA